MLERIESPENVIAIRAVGEVDKRDYETVLDPAVEAMIADRGEVRFVYVLGEGFTGYSMGAAWEDTKVGLGHLTRWKRCAVVTDRDWVRHMVGIFAWMIPGDVKVFPESEVSAAIEWAAT